MLSARTIEVIKQTIPVLTLHGETLTRHFYRRMFEGNPEVKAFFNPAHQESGGQQKALASAILAYAQHIENPQVLGSALELIAHKHVSLGVQPEHYPIVGKHLLGSIREVMGEAATDEVIDAWAAAYGFLADVLIQREAEIYRQHREEHGWQGFEPFVVQKKQLESSVITSFHLARRDGTAVRAFKPGQYITVRVPTPDGGSTMRNYSLSCVPGQPQYRISVKREQATSATAPAGYVSNYLHDRIREGDRLEVGPPCGEFTLEADQDRTLPLVFISAGVGITPVLSMLHAAVGRNNGREIWFIHAAINGDTHAFRREVLDLADRYPKLHVHFRYSNPTPQDRERELFDSEGFIDAELVRGLVGTSGAAFHLCGPKPFMAAVQEGLLSWGVRAEDVKFEFFGPMQSLRQEAEAAV